MIPVEIGEPSLRRHMFDVNLNQESLVVKLNLINEYKEKSRIRAEALEIRATIRYHSKVTPRSFHKEDLV